MSNQSLQDYRRREQIMYSYVPPPSTVAQYQSTSHLNPPDRLIPSIAQSNNHQAPRSAMRHHLPTNPSQAMGMYPSVSSHMSQPPQYHYAPPQTTHQGSLVYAPVTYPISNSHSSGPYNTAQATPQTWLPSRQPSDPKSLRSYQDPRHAQLSGGQGYYIVSQPVPSPSTERSASQTASGRSSRVSSSSTSSRDADCQGLRALADAPDNNTGHPGYAIKVLAEFAIKGSSTGRMSLNDIYLAVEERYPVFRTEEMANWR
ncbi:hypothetical protein FRB94_001188 [Tulasnella sp. JGI-2019a]|nr:hypothetical protein FRB93_010568 [Tulasnella sp. JGI-2019a]KAG9005776.1 hypothetical protein FRB94_001188 [Tulasnella sp. JGI-2019a]